MINLDELNEKIQLFAVNMRELREHMLGFDNTPGVLSMKRALATLEEGLE